MAKTKQPTANVRVQGVQVDMPVRYQEGHTLTAAEARALNTYLHSRIATQVTPQVKAILGDKAYSDYEGEEANRVYEQVQAAVTAAAERFDFGTSRGRGRTSDPVATETMNIAREIVRRSLKDKGTNISQVSAKQVTEMAKRVLADETRAAQIRKRAEAAIQARQELEEMQVDLEDVTA